MVDLHDARPMLEAAERAANAGDLATADELLRGAARIQEAELGPLHPDLAETLNNLAIVAEKTGRSGDAETFYRRAAAIAAASLPADHPMVAASRQNLEDFCFASGLPIGAPAVMTSSAHDSELGLAAFASEDAARAAETPAGAAAADADLTLRATRSSSGTPRASDSRPPTSTAARPLPPPGRASRSLAWVALSVIVLVAAALFVSRPWLSGESSTPAPAAEPTRVEPTAPPAPAEPESPDPIDRTPPPTVAPLPGDRDIVADTPLAPAPVSGAITLATVQLCQTFATGGGNWRCDPAGDSVAPGPLVLYTRVRSPRDTAVVHRWYSGDTLRQSVKLATRANAAEGYRTYSRHTVDGGDDWRVEVTTADGELLHEQRFTVR